MHLNKFILGISLCAAAGILLTGCSDSNEAVKRRKVEGLEQLGNITVISREEGSGTRNVFAELLGFTDVNAELADQTREDAVIAESTESILASVSADQAAIGYVSGGAIPEEGIRELRIEGAAAGEGDENYPLSRTFYLVYSGRLSELEQDFLTYVRGAGQGIVGEKYKTVAKQTSFLSNKAEGSLQIGGSSSVAPLVERLAGEYMTLNPNAKLEVITTDSGDGLIKAMSGQYDLGMSSRDLKDYEKELLEYHAIAVDEIAVVVNKDNPLEDITAEELKEIYTGEISDWEELNQ